MELPSLCQSFISLKAESDQKKFPSTLTPREKKSSQLPAAFWTGVDNFKTVHYLKLKVIPKSIIVFILGAIPCCYYLKPLKWLIPVKDLSKVSDCIATTASFTAVS